MIDLTQIENKNILILGLGETGKAAALRFHSLGAHVKISEKKQLSIFDFQELKDTGIQIEFGGHSDDFCLNVDMAFISPGIDDNSFIVKKLREKNIPCFDELDWVGANFPGKIIAVTGSCGKSTTASWIYQLLKICGIDSTLCGNIGIPACSTWQSWHKKMWLVIEVSSFQAERIKLLHPDIAILSNFSPNHLDRHGNLENYINAKRNLFKSLKKTGVQILHWKDRNFLDHSIRNNRTVYCSTDCDREADIYYQDDSIQGYYFCGWNKKWVRPQAKGLHNRENMLLVLALAKELNIPFQKVFTALPRFQTLPHRMEWVAEIAKRVFYNDSKSTSAESIRAALSSFNAPLILIMGGRNKKSDFSSLIDILVEKTHQVILMGESRFELARQLRKYPYLSFAENIREAVQKAMELSRPNDHIIFSPGCSSFDQFKNFQKRGTAYIDEVIRLEEFNNSYQLQSV